MTKLRTINRLCMTALALLFLAGCAEPLAVERTEELPEDPPLPLTQTANEELSMEAFFSQYTDRAEQPAAYQAPAMNYAEFHADKANGKNNAYLDLSMVNLGVVAAKGTSANRLKFIIVVNGNNYYYKHK